MKPAKYLILTLLLLALGMPLTAQAVTSSPPPIRRIVDCANGYIVYYEGSKIDHWESLLPSDCPRKVVSVAAPTPKKPKATKRVVRIVASRPQKPVVKKVTKKVVAKGKKPKVTTTYETVYIDLTPAEIAATPTPVFTPAQVAAAPPPPTVPSTTTTTQDPLTPYRPVTTPPTLPIPTVPTTVPVTSAPLTTTTTTAVTVPAPIVTTTTVATVSVQVQAVNSSQLPISVGFQCGAQSSGFYIPPNGGSVRSAISAPAGSMCKTVVSGWTPPTQVSISYGGMGGSAAAPFYFAAVPSGTVLITASTPPVVVTTTQAPTMTTTTAAPTTTQAPTTTTAAPTTTTTRPPAARTCIIVSVTGGAYPVGSGVCSIGGVVVEVCTPANTAAGMCRS